MCGNLVVTSAPSEGTTIEVRIPLAPPPLSEKPITKAFRRAKYHYALLLFLSLCFVLGPRIRGYEDFVGSTLILLMPVLAYFFKTSLDSLDATPESISPLRYQIHRNRTLSFLLAAWWAPWHWRLVEEGWTSGRYAWLAVAVVSLVLSLLEMGRFHRSSRFRDPRQVVFPGCLRVTLLAIVGGAIIQSFQKAPHLIWINTLFLLTVGPAVLYALARQPRTEGAPS
ncbi:MAG TPA: hypothetical protein VG477_01810 [Thermoanaerobaculia bacterium]|nr:hypothetical protein [Thermoanaerobaculia bacterium]